MAGAGAATGLALPGTARAARTKNLVVVGENGNLNIVTPGGALLMYYQEQWQTGSGGFLGPFSRGSGFDAFGSIASCGVAYTYDNLYVCANSSGVYGYYWRNGLQAWAYGGAPAPIAGTTSLGWANLSKLISGGYITPELGYPGGSIFYTIDSSGRLFWHKYLGVPGEGGSWAANSGTQIGVGWEGFRYVTGSPSGAIYGVDSSGNIRWYRYQYPYSGVNVSDSWVAGSGNVIGSGWYGGTYGYQTVQAAGVDFSATVGADGGMYMVDKNGNLRWNEHLDWYGGAAEWRYPTGGGLIIGNGWM
ncbi:hypothetical protein GCM10010112_90780 [Actinoplanes lobatus]|uniref:Tachylectin 2 domain-containing protein n=1 Tax=Actinoplanes lobatus TaxID=113568 RepID=A0ABQ4AY72_9ACTN|nr:hypothetical protein GCM10010112_90780 [Actinoplanes lobatus]GIE45863.1 hypothetical protein Alo02nite_87610 [Actinoplanes lobatus]